MTATPNYGAQLLITGLTPLHVISVEAPLTKIGVIETTYHGSGAWRQHITDGLMGMDSFKVSVEASGTLVADAFDIFKLGQPVGCTFTENGMTTWSFDAILLTFDLGKADAQKPEEEILTITLQPTGDLAIAAAAGNWYDDVTTFYFNVNHLALLTGGTSQLVVYAVGPGGSVHQVTTAEMSDLTLADDGGAAVASINATGLITAVGPGDAIITVVAPDPDVNAALLVTVSAP